MVSASDAVAFAAFDLVTAAFAELDLSGPRVFRRRTAGKPSPPYALIHVSETPAFEQAKDEPFSEVRIEVQCYAGTGAEADAVAREVIDRFGQRLMPTGFRVVLQEVENRFAVSAVTTTGEPLEGEVVVCRVRVQPD